MSVAPGGTVRSNDHNILFGENGVRVGGATAEVREEEKSWMMVQGSLKT